MEDKPIPMSHTHSDPDMDANCPKAKLHEWLIFTEDSPFPFRVCQKCSERQDGGKLAMSMIEFYDKSGKALDPRLRKAYEKAQKVFFINRPNGIEKSVKYPIKT